MKLDFEVTRDVTLPIRVSIFALVARARVQAKGYWPYCEWKIDVQDAKMVEIDLSRCESSIGRSSIHSEDGGNKQLAG